MLVVITDLDDESDIEQLAQGILAKLRDDDERKRFFLYCSKGQTYVVYDRHLISTDIVGAKSVMNLSSSKPDEKKWLK